MKSLFLTITLVFVLWLSSAEGQRQRGTGYSRHTDESYPAYARPGLDEEDEVSEPKKYEPEPKPTAPYKPEASGIRSERYRPEPQAYKPEPQPYRQEPAYKPERQPYRQEPAYKPEPSYRPEPAYRQQSAYRPEPSPYDPKPNRYQPAPYQEKKGGYIPVQITLEHPEPLPEKNYRRGKSYEEDGSYENKIPGEPGKDYPLYREAPQTSFYCDQAPIRPGMYADVETGCQVYRVCDDGRYGPTGASFLCTNGTVFDQSKFTCDWWYNVDCKKAPEYYSLNADPLFNPFYRQDELKKIAAEEGRLPSDSHKSYAEPPYAPEPAYLRQQEPAYSPEPSYREAPRRRTSYN